MMPRKKKKPEGPYEVDTTKEADMTEQAAAPAPEDTIEIGDNNDNDEWAHSQDEDDDSTLHPWTARKQGCENDPEEESLFFNESDNDHDDNDPDDDYFQSSDDKNKKKNSKRKTPTSTIPTPGKTHFSRQDITCRARGGECSGCDRRKTQRRQVHGDGWIG